MSKERCQWCLGDSIYENYHDTEWGVPIYDDQILLEFLTLETFQAGLSWITVLQKRENFSRAFHQFDYFKIAKYGYEKITQLKNDRGIIRNQLKIDVIVEVRTQIEIEAVMNFPWVKRILLDNMGPDQIEEKVAWINKSFETEASGSISEENLIRYAETGVDFISMGALTHSTKNVDLSLKAL